MKLCRHCKESSANRPKGLCWSCYYTPGVRKLYPSTSKYAPGSKTHGMLPCEECKDPWGIMRSDVRAGEPQLCVACRKPEDEREYWRQRFAELEEMAKQELPLTGTSERYVRRVDVDHYKEPIYGSGAFEETTEFTAAGAEGFSVHVYGNPYGFRKAAHD